MIKENFSTKFYVVGGEYKNTNFRELVSEREVYGPYETYSEAKNQWASRSWATVDNCHYRFDILKEQGEQ